MNQNREYRFFCTEGYFRLGIRKRAVGLQQKHYNRKHRDVQFAVGDLVLLSTRNLKMRGIPGKLKKRFMGPFKIQERIGR